MTWLKQFLCWTGCHCRWLGYEYAEEYNGFNARMRCSWCGKVGLVDSQGNLS